MPTITESDRMTVQIVRFETEPDRQSALIEAVAAEAERWIRHCPGFVSASFHASTDGREMVNYAQWRSRADYEAFVRHPETARLGEAIRNAAPLSGPEAGEFQVVRHVERAS